MMSMVALGLNDISVNRDAWLDLSAERMKEIQTVLVDLEELRQRTIPAPIGPRVQLPKPIAIQ